RIALENLRKERDQAFLRAELEGVVTVVRSRDLKVSEVLKAEEPVVEIAQEKGFRFELQVPSEDIGHVDVGMPARVRIHAFDYQRYGTLDGTVCFIAPDASVPDGQRAASYLVKIELPTGEVSRGEYRGSIKFGMEGLAEIVTEHESLLSLLVK